MDPAIAYEMRLRFRQDMAQAFGDEWKPENLPKLKPFKRGAIPEDAKRAIEMRRAGASYNDIAHELQLRTGQVWDLIARWAPNLPELGGA